MLSIGQQEGHRPVERTFT